MYFSVTTVPYGGLQTMASNYLAKGLKRSALTVALGLCFAGGVHAQSTTGSVYGKADAGQTVTVVSDTGMTRTVTADASGRYSISALPAGRYKVTAGADTRDVMVLVSSGAQVDFGGATNLETVVVRGTGQLTDIDVSQTDIRTVFTAEDLQQIAVGQSINSVALLAPGVISSTSYSGIGSFGGSAASENAYYINGFPTTNPLTNIGYTSLAFDSIAQQQVLTGGYGAEFGRSTGGVVSVITKRGTNEWHGGVYAIYTPNSLRADAKDIYFPNTGHWNSGTHYNTSAGNNPANWTDGTLYQLNSNRENNSITYGLWAGGPIIKDRLFIYANAERGESHVEQSRYSGTLATHTAAGAPALSATSRAQAWGVYDYTYPRWTAKLDWNITDDHLLELTGIQDNAKNEYAYYGFNYDTMQRDDVKYNGDHVTEDKARTYIAKYTGYLTDNLTISALWGKQALDTIPDPLPGYDASKRYISISPGVVPTAYAGITTPQPYSTITYPTTSDTKAQRFDLTYMLGNHELRAGYDKFSADSYKGSAYTTADNYLWTYGQASNPNTAIDAGHGVGAPATGGGFGTQGYWVRKDYYLTGGAMFVDQEAWYLEDHWQVNDNLLVTLGLRNDKFTNYNQDHVAYLTQKNNWAPRIGFSWDVNGDSTFKVFGNAGRYHLAVPNNVTVRQANGTLSSQQYFTYTGIAADGTPTGLTSITAPTGTYICPNGGFSSNLECGVAPDPRVVTQVGLKPHYQDEFIVGMQRAESDVFSWGAKVTYRDLKNAIDDICPDACYIYNAGDNSPTFWEDDGTGNLVKVTHNSVDDFGSDFPKLKRKYLALDMYAQYTQGGFNAKVEYTLSKNWGNAEGQLNSSIDSGSGGQADVSVTQDWDLPELMFGKGGLLPNNRTHQVKAFGSYKISDEFRVGGSAIVQSGRPRDCLSYWPYAKAGLYNGPYYAYCGVPGAASGVNNPAAAAPDSADYYYAPRGSAGETPWTATFNVNFTYTPNWLKGLTASVDVMNLFDTQTPSAYYQYSASSRTTVNQQYQRVLYYTSPRSVRFTVRYEF